MTDENSPMPERKALAELLNAHAPPWRQFNPWTYRWESTHTPAVTVDPDGTSNEDILHIPYAPSDPRNWVRPGDDDDSQDQA